MNETSARTREKIATKTIVEADEDGDMFREGSDDTTDVRLVPVDRV